MKYTIVHINNDREDTMSLIDKKMNEMNIAKQDILFCNGREDDLDSWYETTGVSRSIDYNYKLGEIGIWQSLANVWKNVGDEPILMFEDDALLHPEFENRFKHALIDLPADADFLTLFVPSNQRADYDYVVRYDEIGNPHKTSFTNRYIYDIGSSHIAKAYQGYGGVAVLFTEQGCKKLLAIAQEKGMYTTSDCFLYLEAHAGSINGYAMLPHLYDTVHIDPNTKTLVQDTERVNKV